MIGSQKYQTVLPSVETYRALIKCQAACPVNTDARGYVTAIGRGDLAAGYRIARGPNPLASMCGQICGAPCEIACRRGSLDEAVAIRPLKRVVTQLHGPEARRQRAEAARQSPSESVRDDESRVRWSRQALLELAAQPGRKTGRVALIGAGPASLSAAHDLALLGHAVTIFEAGPKAGGMVRYGVPAYRIDWQMMDLEIQEIEKLGIDFRYETPVGENLLFEDLRKDFDAVFLGVGLMQGRTLNIEGNLLDGVIKAVDLLLNFNLGYRVELGEKVFVIGGGDVAMDAARTALRAGKVSEAKQTVVAQSTARAEEEAEAIHDALDVARTALRLGAAEVHVVALESWDELPASRSEIEEAIEEGIHIHTGLGPNRIIGENGRVRALETIRVKSVFNEEGRFDPQFVADSTEEWECGTVVLAIGQHAGLDWLRSATDIAINPRGYIQTDPGNCATTASGVFAGGDVAFGPRLMIHAIRDGHLAALGIEAHIQRKELTTRTRVSWQVHNQHAMPENWLNYQRTKVPSLPLDRRTGISQVEIGYTNEQAETQALRCLECSINTVFDGQLCILCNGCVDVCPWNCLKIASPDLVGGPAGEVLAQTPGSLEGMAAMLKDEDLCTRCGLCALRCPTGAITMESFRFEEGLAYKEQS